MQLEASISNFIYPPSDNTMPVFNAKWMLAFDILQKYPVIIHSSTAIHPLNKLFVQNKVQIVLSISWLYWNWSDLKFKTCLYSII